MPEPPTPGVNGQVVSSPALQASSSMLSFAPAAIAPVRSTGFGLTAIAGSFCLFCENGDIGLPTVMSGSPLDAPATAVSARAPESSRTT